MFRVITPTRVACTRCGHILPDRHQDKSAHNCRDLNVPEWLVKARAKHASNDDKETTTP